MRLLRHILREMNYGSLIDTDLYDTLDGPDQRLYKYTADGITRLSNSDFEELEERYPFEGGTLYRGLYFSSEETFNEFVENVSDGSITTLGQSSWSPSRGTAKDFAMTTKTYFPTPEVIKAERDRSDSGDYMSGEGGGVLIKITNAPAGIGVDINKTEFAKESEVLLPAGTYTVEIDQILRPFRRSHDTVDKAKEMLDVIAAYNNTGDGDKKELDKYAHYLEKSFLKKLDPEDVDKLIQFRYSKALALAPADFANLSVDVEESKGWNKERVLRIRVNPHYDHEMYELASSQMRKKIITQIKATAPVLKKKLAGAQDTLSEFDQIEVEGFKELAMFDAALADSATKGIKTSLGKMYNDLNSRETTSKIKSMDAIRAHGKKIAMVIQNIANLG